MADFEGGNDRMVGSAAEDQFFGGDGVDQFVFGAVWNTPPDGFVDVIFDLEDGVEKIDLSGSGLRSKISPLPWNLVHQRSSHLPQAGSR